MVVYSRLGHCATSQKIAGSKPNEVTEFSNLPNVLGHTRPTGFTQTVTEMSTRKRKIRFWGVECCQHVRLITQLLSVSKLSRQCDSFNISQS
jgi:hypothetical protein